MNAPITRKEIARWLNMDLSTIRRNERRMGLHKARTGIGTKRVYYNHDVARRILIDSGLLSV